MRRSQTATEYLIISAIVIVIAIVVISIMGGVPGLGGGTNNAVSKTRLSNLKVGVLDYAVKGGQVIITFANNNPNSIIINSISIDGIECPIAVGDNLYTSLTLKSGEKKTITCSPNFGMLYLSDVDKNNWNIKISYADLSTAAVYSINATASFEGSYITAFGGLAQIVYDASGGTIPDVANAVFVDGAGNVYCAGRGMLGLDFGNGKSITPDGDYDLFVVKYDANGRAQWVTDTTGATGSDSANSVFVDKHGNVYVAGYLASSTNFGNGKSLTYDGGTYDFFIAKYDSSGVAQWVGETTGGTGSDFAKSVFVDESGYIYVVGYVSSSINFGNGKTLTADGSSDMFLVKYDSSGVAQWVAETTGGTGADEASSVFVDQSGNVYVAGHVSSSVNFGNGKTLTNDGAADMFVVKYNSSGVAQWVGETTGGTGADYGKSVFVDKDDNIYVAGHVSTSVSFGSKSLTSDGGTDIYVVKYDSTGSAQWVGETTGGTGADGAYSVFVDGIGNIYVGGDVASSVNFGNGKTLTTDGSSDFFVIKYDSSGVAQWVGESTGATGGDSTQSVFVDNLGSVYLAGWAGGAINFGNGKSYTFDGVVDTFMVKYS